MNDDLIQDLKQFIAATVTQSTSDIRSDIKDIREDTTEIHEDISNIQSEMKKLHVKVDTLDTKIDTISGAIADAPEESNTDVQKQLDSHDARLLKLEQQPA